MNINLRTYYQRLHPFTKVAIYLGGNYGLVFLAQFIGPWGEITVNVFLCLAVWLFTKYILHLEGQNLDTIGWRPMKLDHVKQLFAGIIIGMCMLVSTALILKWQTGFIWMRTPLPFLMLLQICITIFASAYVQELAFRGYPFQLLLTKYGLLPAQIIIALLFGCMHLQRGMSLTNVLTTLFTTGLGSLLFGLAYYRTKNLALPTGIHFGWNLLQVLLPRHPSQNGHGIVKIVDGSFNDTTLNLLTWILPYAAISMIAGIALFLYTGKAATTDNQ